MSLSQNFDMEEDDVDESLPEFDPQNLNSRETFRRYGKRSSISSVSPLERLTSFRSPESGLVSGGSGIAKRENAALFLEDVKQEVENFEVERTLAKTLSVTGNGFRKTLKQEDDGSVDSGQTTFTLFASLMESALQGLMPFPDLILQFENTCRQLSELVREEAFGRHRIVEDKMTREKSKLLLAEAATWSLLWHLFGKGDPDLTESLLQYPSTSQQEACKFVLTNHTAQLCLRLVQWLEGLASKNLDLEKKIRGWHVGSYLQNSGLWHRTQRLLSKGSCDFSVVEHLDFDAPSREGKQILPEDKKQEESFLEDVWNLLRAGRLKEACELCRSAGQPWRVATICPFGDLSQCPSVEALEITGKNRSLQAIELESGIGYQRLLYKWACFSASEKIANKEGGIFEAAIFALQCSNLKHVLPVCKDWESACWAMTKSWLDSQIDLELSSLAQSRLGTNSSEDSLDVGSGHDDYINSRGPEAWPTQIIDQQPHDLHALLQRIHSGEMMHESISQGCHEQHRQIEMDLMLGDLGSLLDLLNSWVAPEVTDQIVYRPTKDPQMIRFAAHLVLVLRYLLVDDIVDTFREKLMLVGDLILHVYAVFLFSEKHEELVGVYASQLAPFLCMELFVHMMELRVMDSAHVKYKIFRTAVEYLPFSTDNTSKASFEDILDRVLVRSREVDYKGTDGEAYEFMEQHHLQIQRKAMAVQWMCFTPPSTANDCDNIKIKLLKRALAHSNMLFREFSLTSLKRSPTIPIGAHMLLSLLAEPLQQPIDTLVSEEDEVSVDLLEFQDWHQYYSCDSTYRQWLKIELENATIQPSDLSEEEREKASVAAQECLKLSLAIVQRKQDPWLVRAHAGSCKFNDSVLLELHMTSLLCQPSGEYIVPDTTLCTTLTSALYSAVDSTVAEKHQLMVSISVSRTDDHYIEGVLRCVVSEEDDLDLAGANHGGLLAEILASGIKGELTNFQLGVSLEIIRLDAWCMNHGDSFRIPVAHIIRGLCFRCCLPELILRAMQVYVSLADIGLFPASHAELVELVASSNSGFLHMFTEHQLQEFLLLVREYSICQMRARENFP